MEKRGEIILSSIIIAAALIVCTIMLTKTNFFMGYSQTDARVTGGMTVSDGNIVQQPVGEVMTIFDAARYLGMDENTLRTSIGNGNTLGIPYINAGKQIIFSKKALDEWAYNTSKSKLNSKP